MAVLIEDIKNVRYRSDISFYLAIECHCVILLNTFNHAANTDGGALSAGGNIDQTFKVFFMSYSSIPNLYSQAEYNVYVVCLCAFTFACVFVFTMIYS